MIKLYILIYFISLVLRQLHTKKIFSPYYILLIYRQLSNIYCVFLLCSEKMVY